MKWPNRLEQRSTLTWDRYWKHDSTSWLNSLLARTGAGATISALYPHLTILLSIFSCMCEITLPGTGSSRLKTGLFDQDEPPREEKVHQVSCIIKMLYHNDFKEVMTDGHSSSISKWSGLLRARMGNLLLLILIWLSTDLHNIVSNVSIIFDFCMFW